MNKTEISNLKDKDDNIVGIRVQTAEKDFTIPVMDVRVSDGMRRKAIQFMKEQNAYHGSKFLNPSYSLWGYKY